MRFIRNSLIKRITKELEFFHSFHLETRPEKWFKSHILDYENHQDWLAHVIDYIKSNKIGLINYNNECIPDIYYTILIKEIEKSGNHILIKSSNAYDSPFGFHPLTNIAIWELHTMPDKNIFNQDNNDHGKYIKPFNAWDDSGKINISNKSNEYRYLLSVRRKTPIRNILFDKINSFPRKWGECGVVRYSKYDEQKKTANFNLTTSEIIEEHKKSYISFVVETIYHDVHDDNLNYSINLTEKTLMAFQNKCIPLFLGCKNLVKSLKKMGFYTFDDQFNLKIDDISTLDEERLDLYIDCLASVDAMSMEEIEEIYDFNFEKVEYNYKLVNHLFQLNHSIQDKYQALSAFGGFNLDN